MKYSNFLSRSWLFLAIMTLPAWVVSVQNNSALVDEYIVSLNIEDFDCHSSSLIEISPGVLCSVWKGGRGKGLCNIDMLHHVGIWRSHFKNGHWSEPEQIVYSPDTACWNPVLAKYPNGELLLFYRVGPDPRHTISLVKSSLDGGVSWSKAEILPAGIVGPTKARPLIDQAGNLICGSSMEFGAPEEEFKSTACWIEILSGRQWKKYGPLEIPGKRFGCIEPTLFFGKNGTLRLLCRDRSHRIGSTGWIWTAESLDGGKTWSDLKKTELPNPDASIAAVSVDPEHVLLIYNHSHTNRYPLSLALSEDGGNSWTRLFNIEEGSGEVPSTLIDSQGRLHVIYAWRPPGKSQRQIKHVIIAGPWSTRSIAN